MCVCAWNVLPHGSDVTGGVLMISSWQHLLLSFLLLSHLLPSFGLLLSYSPTLLLSHLLPSFGLLLSYSPSLLLSHLLPSFGLSTACWSSAPPTHLLPSYLLRYFCILHSYLRPSYLSNSPRVCGSSAAIPQNASGQVEATAARSHRIAFMFDQGPWLGMSSGNATM